MVGLCSQSLGGRALTVSFPQANRGGARVPSERPFRDRPFGGGGYDSENKLFIGNLSWGVDDESLRAKFSDYGKVLDAKVIYDRESGRSRGFGFVTYSNADEVNDAIQNLDGAVRQLPSVYFVSLSCSSCRIVHYARHTMVLVHYQVQLWLVAFFNTEHLSATGL